MSQPLPLKGIRVIDYSHFLAGPYAVSYTHLTLPTKA